MTNQCRALYVHIPFCARKCAYCDFESYALSPSLSHEYIDRVLMEARAARDTYGDMRVSTLFIGGGTPSFIASSALTRLIRGLSDLFPFDAGAEITIEANPGTVDAAKLSAYREAGVNRLSFGAQAMQPRLLQMLGRIHDWADVKCAARLSREAGFDNINFDLMYALPGQSPTDWTDTLNAALELSPAHLSCYSLILEPGTPLYARVQSGALSQLDDEEVIAMSERAVSLLERAGYQRYEISNFARPGRECRHNIVYWTCAEYLGLGASAHSLMMGARFFNPTYRAYMDNQTREAPEVLTERARMEEHIMLETRMTRGLYLTAFGAQFGMAALGTLLERARPLADTGLLTLDNHFLALTQRGLNVQNAVVVRLFPE